MFTEFTLGAEFTETTCVLWSGTAALAVRRQESTERSAAFPATPALGDG